MTGDNGNMRRVGLILVAGTLLGLAACANNTGPKGPEQRDQSQLHFLHFPASLVSRLPGSDSVWAVSGQDTKLVLRYAPSEPGGEGDEFLTFDVPGDALATRPDGSVILPGDSVLIKVIIDSQGRFLFHFEPSGLTFHSEHPAKLSINYIKTGGDLNGDGEVDAQDSTLQQTLSIWKQEQANEPWLKVSSVKLQEEEIEAQIYGFTGFCVAGL